ncbi:MAG: hypothetical protein HWE30_17700 [Methylocystaceae bacterium]|nr:hypothetical protein [Methylocystaceae bacterium]
MLTSDIAMNPDVAEISRCAYGARKSSPERRKNNELVKQYDGLQTYQIEERWEVLEILRRVKSIIGLNDALINHLDYIMKRIPVREWEQGGCPIFYQTIVNQTDELGICPRAIRYRESKLAELGFLAFHDSANGRRHPVKPNGVLAGAYGVSLIPLMMRVDELRQIDYEHRLIIHRKRKLRAEAAALKRRIAVLIDEALMSYEGLEERCIEWAERRKSIRSIRSDDSFNVMERRLDAYVDLEREILLVLADCDAQKKAKSSEATMGKTCGMTKDISSTAENDFPHIYTNTESNNSKGYYSNTPEHSSGDKSKQSSPKGSQVDGLDVSKAHAAHVNASKEEACAKNRVSKGRSYNFAADFDELEHLSGAEYLSPSHIYEAACRKFREAVDIVSNNAIPKDLTITDIKLAGEYLSSHLSISPYTWNNANQVLGRYAAAIGIMLACRTHVRNAGAYLNGLITKQHNGELHLHKSVFGQLSTSKRGRLN